MRLPTIIFLACTLVSAAAVKAQEGYNTQKERFSYALGYQLGNSLKRDDLDLDAKAVTQAIEDVLSGADPKMTSAEMEDAIAAARQQLAQERQALAASNKAAGEKFLAENKNLEGIKQTASGLQYKVVKEGSGPRPKATDTVVVHYRGTLLDGSEFDSSYQRQQPASLPLNGVIKGWQEGLQLMTAGSRYTFYIPAELAYGERGAGNQIGPNSTLVFEVELLEIK